MWKQPPVCFLKDNELIKEEDDDEEDEMSELSVPEEEPSAEHSQEAVSGILELSKAKIIDSKETNDLNAVHSASFKKQKAVACQRMRYSLIRLKSKRLK